MRHVRWLGIENYTINSRWVQSWLQYMAMPSIIMHKRQSISFVNEHILPKKSKRSFFMFLIFINFLMNIIFTGPMETRNVSTEQRKWRRMPSVWLCYLTEKISETEKCKKSSKEIRITATVAKVTPEMLRSVWQETDYRWDVCCITNGSHIEP